MMEFVSWDDAIPNRMESHKIPWFQNHQPAIITVTIEYHVLL